MLQNQSEREELAGLGLAIEVTSDDICRVLHTIVGGAAHCCGKITPGDILVGVLDHQKSPNFISTKGLDFNAVRSLISGRRGTKVTLQLRHSDPDLQNELYYCESLERGLIQPASLLPPRSAQRPLPFSVGLLPSPGMFQGAEGVGIVLDFRAGSDYPVVGSLIDGRSAKACGKIAVGDSLMSVDGKSAERKSFDEIRQMIAGPAGTHVSLCFKGQDGFYECERLLRGDLKGRSPQSAVGNEDYSHVELGSMIPARLEFRGAERSAAPVSVNADGAAECSEGDEVDGFQLFGAVGWAQGGPTPGKGYERARKSAPPPIFSDMPPESGDSCRKGYDDAVEPVASSSPPITTVFASPAETAIRVQRGSEVAKQAAGDTLDMARPGACDARERDPVQANGVNEPLLQSNILGGTDGRIQPPAASAFDPPPLPTNMAAAAQERLPPTTWARAAHSETLMTVSAAMLVAAVLYHRYRQGGGK